MTLYVKSQLEESSHLYRGARIHWLLKVALQLEKVGGKYPSEIDLETVRLLLDHGADPSYRLDGRLLWDYFLSARRPDGSSLADSCIDRKLLDLCIEVLLFKGTNADSKHMVVEAIRHCLQENKPRLYALL